MKVKILKKLLNREILAAKFKKLGKKYKRSSELQLVTVLALGILAGGSIIFGFAGASESAEKTQITSVLAKNVETMQTAVN